MRLRTLAAVLAASPLALAGCAETARTVGGADVGTASAPTIYSLCDSHEARCLQLYYALSAEAFGTEGNFAPGGLEELYERRERSTEDWAQRNLEDLRAGTFRSHHGIGGASSPAEYVRERMKAKREADEKLRNDVSRRLETTSHLQLAEEARQFVKNVFCYYEHEPYWTFYPSLIRSSKVAPGHPDAGAPLVDCSDYTGPRQQPFPGGSSGSGRSEDFKAWLRELEGGAK